MLVLCSTLKASFPHTSNKIEKNTSTKGRLPLIIGGK
jgi:hypothetical protein